MMFKKSLKNHSNISKCVGIILTGAKKRRSMALLAVQTLNNDLGVRPQLFVVK